MKEIWPLSEVIGYLQYEPPYIGNGPPHEALALSESFTAVFNVLANGTRIGLAFIYILLWLTLPLLRGPLVTLWARLVESERPVFSLVFGGVAAIGSAVEAVVKNLF